MSTTSSTLGSAYRKLYARLCGTNANPLPWHFQWLSAYYLQRHLRKPLAELTGTVLDVGCGDKPYRTWLKRASQHLGLDVYSGSAADFIVSEHEAWPLEDRSCDAVFATQVLEHVEDLSHTVSEINRVAKPGGRIIITVPFLYNEHGAPNDYRRITRFGLQDFAPEWTLLQKKTEGAIGSTLTTLLLNWIDTALNQSRTTRLIKGLLLPAWIALSLVSNLLALAIDQLDRTESFYSNLYLEFEKSTSTDK